MNKKPKLLLIIPPRLIRGGENLLPIPSLGMAQIAELYKKSGFEVHSEDIDIRICNNSASYLKYIDIISKITDEELEEYLIHDSRIQIIDDLLDMLLSTIDTSGFDLYGISIGDRSCAYSGFILGKHLKSINKKVIGGGGCLRQEDEKYDAFTEYFIGRFTDKANLDFMQKEFNIDTSNIKLEKYPRPKPNFDHYPFEAFHNLSKIIPEKYMLFNPDSIHFIPYQWSWNCPHSCSFCTGSISDDKKVYTNEKETIISELKELSEKYDSKYFFMLNEYCHMLPKHSRKLYSKMKDLDISWCGACRCDLDLEMAKSMSDAGCRFMCFGFESGSKKVLSDMNKAFDINSFENILKENSQNNVWNALYLLIGFPTETEKDFKDTFEFVDRNINHIDNIYPCPYYLSPSDITVNPDKYDITISNSKFDLRHTSEQDMKYSRKDGTSYDDIQKEKDIRMFQINKLFYLHKQIKEFYLRGALFFILSSLRKLDSKKKSFKRLSQHYQENFNSKFVELKITDNDRLNKDNWNINIKTLTDKDFSRKTILTGKEPTIHPKFLDIIKGFAEFNTEVVTETDGLSFSIEKNCSKMYDSGLRKINLKLFGFDKKSYEESTKIPGSFDMMLKGVKNWKKLGGNVETTCANDLSSYNLYELTKLMYKLESPNRFF